MLDRSLLRTGTTLLNKSVGTEKGSIVRKKEPLVARTNTDRPCPTAPIHEDARTARQKKIKTKVTHKCERIYAENGNTGFL